MPDSEVPMVSPIRGRFQAIDSFAIRRRNEFYIIGTLEEGEMHEQWFAQISMNSSFAISIKISRIETIQMATAAERQDYQLLVVAADSEEIDLLLGLNIGLEPIKISTEGED
ncbi:hypothetical protein [Hymenobacter ruricola]|uniref:STAS domain-containing protein n=1 Tax=Hymenobacter ruricola TaxID=2791023 RepID=A0ABS0HYE8_9BACT|nr:hypothetical protein [Hymenobacter ruricola]MBF9219729.1 hypothetical protein [Hymenobacter ruricola]